MYIIHFHCEEKRGILKNAKKSHKVFLGEFNFESPQIEIISEYKGRNKHISCKCKKCGKIVGNYKTEAKAKSKISKCLSGCCLEELIYGGVIEIEDNSKLFEAQIKTKKLEEVLKLSSKEINDYINGDLNDSKPQETLEVTNTLKKININDYA